MCFYGTALKLWEDSPTYLEITGDCSKNDWSGVRTWAEQGQLMPVCCRITVSMCGCTGALLEPARDGGALQCDCLVNLFSNRAWRPLLQILQGQKLWCKNTAKMKLSVILEVESIGSDPVQQMLNHLQREEIIFPSSLVAFLTWYSCYSNKKRRQNLFAFGGKHSLMRKWSGLKKVSFCLCHLPRCRVLKKLGK